ncbi:C2 calcium/lipid-binding plant phosphoribosyltransferase family protein [Actinidia rufa]|uniref:C2 calcium/lipid-binding plant phosphoribosyltransferase family protein n=1 Tax=Actinidia rufa TaxID=165716 RepID=A0A7J0F4W3_9ERIC|nr:C2 calcium/lipid-binding plant phosphoribosyltransferase family protein [Actinidia rufa]
MRGGGGWISSERATSSYDLVEQMYYLYARVVKAKDLPTNPVTGSCDPYIEVNLGNSKGKTQHFEKRTSPECKQVFAFSKEKIQSSVLEVLVRDKRDGWQR